MSQPLNQPRYFALMKPVWMLEIHATSQSVLT